MFDRATLNRLYRYGLSLTNEEQSAYDLVQTALERYLSRRQHKASAVPHNPAHLHAYLVKSMRHAYIDRWRQQQHHPALSWDDHVQEHGENDVLSAGFQALDDLIIDRQHVQYLMARLHPSERELLYLWAVEGYTVQELADITETPKGTLLSRIFRLRHKIQKATPSASALHTKEARS